MASPELTALVKELVAALRVQQAPAHAGNSPASAPAGSLLMVKGQQSGRVYVLPFDEENQGIPVFLQSAARNPFDFLDFTDQAGNPSIAGRLQRNGALLLFHDGSAARRLILSSDATPASANILIHNGTIWVPVAMSGDTTVSSAGVVAIGANKVTDAMLRQSAARSIICRREASTGNVADLTASADGQILQRRLSDGTLAFQFPDGVNDASNAAAGKIGEAVVARQSTVANVPGATGVWANTTLELDLSAGDWDVTAQVLLTLNAATMTAWQMAVSAFSGATTTDHVSGDNVMGNFSPPTAAYNSAGYVASFRMNNSSTVTAYLKLNVTYSAGTPQYLARLSARRVR